MSGSQSSSDDSNDSRKRPSEEQGGMDTSPKRPNCEDNVHSKVLIPSMAAGAVIGKSGEAIGNIQKETGTKVKISKQNEYYPGTTERVCLIVGSFEGVMSVHNYIMDRIMEKPDPNPHTTVEGRLNVERHKQVKILVPNSTAGMVIGKGGSYIQEIKEKTGAYVQISQKSKEFNLPERCIIIAGDLDRMRSAVRMILGVIATDPQSSGCPNLSYHDVRGPVASVYPTGSPYATPIIPCLSSPGLMLPSSTHLHGVDHPATAAAVAMVAAAIGSGPVSPVGSSTASSGGAGLLPDLSSLTSYNQAAAAAAALASQAALGSIHAQASQFVAQQPSLFAAFRQQQQSYQSHDRQQALSGVPAPLFSPQPLLSGPIRIPSAAYGPGGGAGLGTMPSPPAPAVMNTTAAELHSPSTGASAASSACSSPSVAASVALAALAAAAASVRPVVTVPAGGLSQLASPTISSYGDEVVHQSASSSPSLLMFPGLTGATVGTRLSTVPQATGLYPISPAGGIGVTTAPTDARAANLMGLYAFPAGLHSPGASGSNCMLFKRELPVPESLVGIILGPHGRSIVDMQSQTGTLIQISQKGDYIPGTQNRLVTITGAQTNVQWAATFIEERIVVEQARRETNALQPRLSVAETVPASSSSPPLMSPSASSQDPCVQAGLMSPDIEKGGSIDPSHPSRQPR